MIYVVKIDCEYMKYTGTTPDKRKAIGTTCFHVANYWANERKGRVIKTRI